MRNILSLLLVPLCAVSVTLFGAGALADTAKKADAPDVFHPLGPVDLSGLAGPRVAPEDWREVLPENLIYLKTRHGLTLIELAPDFAPNHAQRMRDLTHAHYFDGLPFHRVLKGFMAQAGDNRLVKRPGPTTPPLAGEFLFKRSPADHMVVVGEKRAADAGFVNGFKIASQPDSLAAMTADHMVRAWPLHCPGAAAMARLDDPNSANAQFYITTGYPESLEKNYTSWGRVRAGLDMIKAIKLGEPPYPPDLIQAMQLGSDVAADERAQVFVMRTERPAFKTYLQSLRNDDGQLPDICDIMVPVAVYWPVQKTEENAQ